MATIYELAGAMAARGHDVHLFHVGAPDFRFDAHSPDSGSGTTEQPPGLGSIAWHTFPEGLVHHFADGTPHDVDALPSADVIFGHGETIESNPRVGLPVVLIQGYKMFSKRRERSSFEAPCPKVCVAAWLVEVAHRRFGVPLTHLVHVPNGLRHEDFPLTRAIRDRPRRVCFCYSEHFQKDPDLAIEVVSRLRVEVPDVQVVAFGADHPAREVPSWIDYRRNPQRRELVDDVYNRSRLFLQTSHVEGFGLTAVEAMSCGAALVTTDNGGSREYAEHDSTALVSDPGDCDAMVGHAAALLDDPERCARLATAGRAYVQRFTWDRSAELLETFLRRYLADPAAYGRPVRHR